MQLVPSPEIVQLKSSILASEKKYQQALAAAGKYPLFSAGRKKWASVAASHRASIVSLQKKLSIAQAKSLYRPALTPTPIPVKPSAPLPAGTGIHVRPATTGVHVRPSSATAQKFTYFRPAVGPSYTPAPSTSPGAAVAATQAASPAPPVPGADMDVQAQAIETVDAAISESSPPTDVSVAGETTPFYKQTWFLALAVAGGGYATYRVYKGKKGKGAPSKGEKTDFYASKA